MRLLVPASFVFLSLVVMYGVMKFLKKDPRARAAMVEPGKRTEKKPTVKRIEPEDTSFESLTATGENPSIPVVQPPMPVIGDAQTDLPPELQPVDGGMAALALLEDFLVMKTLEERLPHIETKLPESELIASVLNGPLPEVLGITVDVRETNAIEQVIDFYYHVDFASRSEEGNPQTMLVRTRGTSPPKVVVDPFLDLFGGKFAAFAEKPSKEAGTFQVIISAGAFCYDEVPGPEKKFTLKILAREDAKEIARAYFGKRSKIGDMLEDESSGLAYGQAKPCTIFMRWNTEEDPERPFLEALDITALDWNP